METWMALALGVVQGLTEFLPVSSSGHLVVFQALFGFRQPLLFFDVMVHLATLGSLAAVFRSDLLWLGRSVASSPNPHSSSRVADGRRMVGLLVVGTLPVVVLGALLHRPLENLFASPQAVGSMLVVTGLILWATKKLPAGLRRFEAMRWSDALFIGLAQGCGLVPGISRTGATIVMALFLGLERELAARYSLLLAMPAIAGAVVWQSLTGGLTATGLGAVVAAMAVAFVTGYVALRILVRVVVAGRLAAFAPYCWLVGLLAIVMAALV